MKDLTNNTNSVIIFFSRPYVYAAFFSLFLSAVFVFALFDAFVIPRSLQPVPQYDASLLTSVMELPIPTDSVARDVVQMADNEEITQILTVAANGVEGETRRESDIAEYPEDKTKAAPVDMNENKDKTPIIPVITAASYKDRNIEISIETVRAYDTDVYVADVKVGNVAYIRTAFAGNTFGRNISEKTSVIADRHNAILAINGDYYGFRGYGWVLRNGSLYRSGRSDTGLLMDLKGDLSCDKNRASIEKKLSNLWQIWSFGPPLVVDGAVFVSKNQEISGRSSISNPRTAIGQAGNLHYILIVSDGRTKASDGLSLYELATLFKERGCSVAYNLDGGGSATMCFNGRLINKPTTGGNRIIEREISDIVYIGY